MKTITTFLTAALSTLMAGAVLAQDFSHFEYRNIGPSRGGRVTAVAGTVAEPGTFYLGASGGGVWKTEDYGTTWQVVSDSYFETPSIGDIAVAQNDPNIVYVGTGSDGLRSNVIAGKGMYKSIDGGDTWQHIGLREAGQIGAVEFDPLGCRRWCGRLLRVVDHRRSIEELDHGVGRRLGVHGAVSGHGQLPQRLEGAPADE